MRFFSVILILNTKILLYSKGHTLQVSLLSLKVSIARAPVWFDGMLLAFYRNNMSSNPADNKKFLSEKTKINKNMAWVGPYFKKKYSQGYYKCHERTKKINLIGLYCFITSAPDLRGTD